MSNGIRNNLAAAIALVSAMVAAQGAKVTLHAKDGVWEVTRVSQYLVKALGGDAYSLHCVGSPAVAKFNGGLRTFKASVVDANAHTVDGQMAIDTLTLSGGVTGDQTSESKSLHVQAKTMKLTAQTWGQNLDLVGDVAIKQVDRRKGVTVLVSGKLGNVAQTNEGWRKGRLEDSVHVVINGKTKSGSPVDIDATCGRMDFELKTVPYKITLKDNVVVQGKNLKYFGESRVDEMEILLDADYQLSK